MLSENESALPAANGEGANSTGYQSINTINIDEVSEKSRENSAKKTRKDSDPRPKNLLLFRSQAREFCIKRRFEDSGFLPSYQLSAAYFADILDCANGRVDRFKGESYQWPRLTVVNLRNELGRAAILHNLSDRELQEIITEVRQLRNNDAINENGEQFLHFKSWDWGDSFKLGFRERELGKFWFITANDRDSKEYAEHESAKELSRKAKDANRKKAARAAVGGKNRDEYIASSVSEACRRAGISRGRYYKLPEEEKEAIRAGVWKGETGPSHPSIKKENITAGRTCSKRQTSKKACDGDPAPSGAPVAADAVNEEPTSDCANMSSPPREAAELRPADARRIDAIRFASFGRKPTVPSRSASCRNVREFRQEPRVICSRNHRVVSSFLSRLRMTPSKMDKKRLRGASILRLWRRTVAGDDLAIESQSIGGSSTDGAMQAFGSHR
ncbi:hypothetical protein [Methylocella silvestris]|uniref:hypothetical protein n=1 Tax=Methylocella silvestris TaxID=199596 RepID=UPI0011AFAFAA|nr:hypothetical protein [Methylocella silvestris]